MCFTVGEEGSQEGLYRQDSSHLEDGDVNSRTEEEMLFYLIRKQLFPT